MKLFHLLRPLFLLFLFLGVVQPISAQDTTAVFTHEEFLNLVNEHHPLARVASLKQEEGQFIRQAAKGNFDPKLYGNAQQKYFDGKQYYSYLNGGLKIPTWFGLTLHAEYNANSGVRLNPESYTANTGLWNAGATIQLGKGLLIDERRAELKQAEIYQNSTELEQNLMLNQLQFDASMAYFDWFKAYNHYTVYDESVLNAQLRLENMKGAANFGDKPAIDTLKALIQLQERQLKLEQSRVALLNKKVQLELFLWQDGFVPLELSDGLVPLNYKSLEASITPLFGAEYIDSLTLNHPELVISENKLAITKIDYRLKRESLKPIIELKYNALSSNENGTVLQDYSMSNYAWGAKISYPIFTRKERANVNLTGLKLDQQEAQLSFKQEELRYKIESALNSWTSTFRQLEIYEKSVNNYRILLNSEVTLFEAGESSMFMVNTRDRELIDAQLKLIEVMVHNKQGETWYNYASFNLP